MRCSEADCLSRVLLSQASRQATVSLIFDVRQNRTMKIAAVFLPRKVRDAFDERARTSDEELARIDYLRSLRPITFIVALGFSALVVARIALGFRDWTHFATFPIYLALAVSNFYVFSRSKTLLKKKEK